VPATSLILPTSSARVKALAELREAQGQLKQHIQVIEKNQQGLATLNAVSSLVSQSLELQQVLNVAVDKVMEVMDVEAVLVFLLGYSREELVGRRAPDFLSEQNLAVAREVRRKLLSGEVLGQPYEQRLINKDGSEVIIKMATSIITSDG